jgi:hypothetical protein
MHNESFATVLLNDNSVIEKLLQLQLQQLQQPNINASYVFDTHRIVLGNNVKNPAVTWLNGDVDHERTITVIQGNSIPSTHTDTLADAAMYESGGFDYNTAKTSTSFNDTCVYTWNTDTVGVLMVPSQDIQTYTSDLHNRGFTIDITYNFKDLRGGQSGTGDEQTLIVWTTSGMGDIVRNLQEFTLELPYS